MYCYNAAIISNNWEIATPTLRKWTTHQRSHQGRPQSLAGTDTEGGVREHPLTTNFDLNGPVTPEQPINTTLTEDEEDTHYKDASTEFLACHHSCLGHISPKKILIIA